MRELIAEVRGRYPKDDFFSNFEESCRIWPNKRKYYQRYERLLKILDKESWNILKEKALKHFLHHREGQRKQGFFNILNEAFAYRYLFSKVFDNVRFLEEEKNRSNPDITFTLKSDLKCCEVKTLGISDD
jgi:hypothetical protein